MAVKSLKTPDTHPYMVVKKYLDPEEMPKFRYFKEAQNWVIRDIEKLKPMFKALNDQPGLEALEDLVEQANSLSEAGGLVSGVCDPRTQLLYTAEVVKRT